MFQRFYKSRGSSLLKNLIRLWQRSLLKKNPSNILENLFWIVLKNFHFTPFPEKVMPLAANHIEKYWCTKFYFYRILAHNMDRKYFLTFWSIWPPKICTFYVENLINSVTFHHITISETTISEYLFCRISQTSQASFMRLLLHLWLKYLLVSTSIYFLLYCCLFL